MAVIKHIFEKTLRERFKGLNDFVHGSYTNKLGEPDIEVLIKPENIRLDSVEGYDILREEKVKTIYSFGMFRWAIMVELIN